MSLSISRPAAVAVAGVTALTLAMPAAAGAATHHSAARHASGTHSIKSGKTTLAVDGTTYLGLANAGYTVSPQGRAKLNGTSVTFPITGGRVNVKRLTGTVKEAGGLSISKGGTTIVMKNAVADLHTRTATAATTGKGRHFLALKLTKPTSTSSTSRRATIDGYTVSLSNKAIAYLDKTFSTTDFKTFHTLGTASTTLHFK